MNIGIYKDAEGDLPAILRLIEQAFKDSDHTEHLLVERLHSADTFIPELSLVAKTDEDRIVGYILLTKVKIVSNRDNTESLAVAPLAVPPEYQNKGIGGMLPSHAHKIAAGLGFGTVLVLGHKDYYPRFGFHEANKFEIEFPFDVPSEYCQVIELLPDALDGVSSMVCFPATFFE